MREISTPKTFASATHNARYTWPEPVSKRRVGRKLTRKRVERDHETLSWCLRSFPPFFMHLPKLHFLQISRDPAGNFTTQNTLFLARQTSLFFLLLFLGGKYEKVTANAFSLASIFLVRASFSEIISSGGKICAHIHSWVFGLLFGFSETRGGVMDFRVVWISSNKTYDYTCSIDSVRNARGSGQAF